MAELKTINECLKMISNAYDQFILDTKQVQLWQLMLQDTPDELLRAGTIQLINTFVYPVPKIADLKDAIKSIQNLVLAETGTPGEAYSIATRAVQNFGHSKMPDVPPLVWQAINAIGGWRNFCLTEDVTAARARFMTAYEQLKSRQLEDATRPAAIDAYVQQQRQQLQAGYHQVLASWTCR